MRKWFGKFVECCALTSIYPRGSSIVVLSHCVFTLPGIFLKYTADIIKKFLCTDRAIGFLLHSFVFSLGSKNFKNLFFLQIIEVAILMLPFTLSLLLPLACFFLFVHLCIFCICAYLYLQPPCLLCINVCQPGFLSGKTPPARCVYFPVVFVASISERGMMRGGGKG